MCLDKRNTDWAISWLSGFSFMLGLGLALLAEWILYVQPLYRFSSSWDPIFDQYSVLASSDFVQQLHLPNQLGLLCLVAALGFFCLASIGRSLFTTCREAVTRSQGVEVRARPAVAALAIVVAFPGLWLVGKQVGQVLEGVPPPLPAWLRGMAFFLLASLIYDASKPRDLVRTMADLLIALGIFLSTLGLACLLAGREPGWALLGGGLALFVSSAWGAALLGSSVRPMEHCAVLVLTLLACAATASRIWLWRLAFVGDEYGFYWTASSILHEPASFQWLGRNGPFTVLSFAMQSGTMLLAGEDVFGWRLSSILPFVLSIGPVFYFLRCFCGRSAAWIGAGLLAGCHLLTTFSLIGYNNTQALLPLSMGLGLIAFCARRPSTTRSLLLGFTLGLTCFVFAVARLAVIPIGILLLGLWWRRKSWIRGWLVFLAGFIALSAPILFDWLAWKELLPATPLKSEAIQVARNVIHGFLTFASSSQVKHFVVGPHVDPLTAVLLLLGVAGILSQARRSWFAIAWALGSALFVLLVSGVQQYENISTTRMFILVPIYAIYAGMGGSMLIQWLAPKDSAVRGALAGLIVSLGALLNFTHMERLSLPPFGWEPIPMLISEFQSSGAADGGGMPVFLVQSIPPDLGLASMVRAHGIGRERIAFLSQEEAVNAPAPCEAANHPAMMLIPANLPTFDMIRQRIKSCWPGFEETLLRSPSSAVQFYRIVTESGQPELLRNLRDRLNRRHSPDTLPIDNPGDVAVDPAGNLYVLRTSPAEIRVLSSRGTLERTIPLGESVPSAVAWTRDGLLVVASTSPQGASLSWFQPQGGKVRETGTRFPVRYPAGLAVAADGRLLVADPLGARIVIFSKDGDMLGELHGIERLSRPCSVAAGSSGTIWALDESGQLLQVAPDNAVLSAISTAPTAMQSCNRFLVMSDETLILVEPQTKRVVRRNAKGELLQVWGGFERPSSIAVDPMNRLLVTDQALDQIGILQQ